MELGLVILTIIVVVLLILGTIGIIDPRIPDIPLIWLGIFLFSLLTGWTIIDLPMIAFLTFSMLMVLLLDLITLSRKSRPRRHDASHVISLIAAILSGIIGSLIFFPLGIFLGVLWGALLGELAFTPDKIFSYETKFFRVIGFVGTTLLKISVAVLMIGIFFQKLFTL